MKGFLKDKQINGIISIAALLIFFIWGMNGGTYEHSGLVFIVAPLVMAVASMLTGSDVGN